MRIFALSAAESQMYWDDFAHHFERFERVGDRTAAEIKESAGKEMMQVWGLQDSDEVHGVAVTEIIETASGRVCVICAACGTARKPMQERLLDEIGKWAAEIGCVKVSIQGRKGWLRYFPRFRQTGIVAEWPLKKVH